MYDDSYTADASWYPGIAREDHVHLCPECRDLMYDVLTAHRRVLDAEVSRPPTPDWQRALAWLDAQCGGRDAVLALDDRPLSGPRPEPPAGWTPEQIGRFRSITAVLDATAQRFFDAEFGLALERALILVFRQRPGVLLDQRTSVAAHGVVWAVAKANGLLHPVGIVTDRSLREFLDSKHNGSTLGRKVQVAIRSVFDWSDPSPEMESWRWPINRVELEPLGQPALLVGKVRRRLIEVRERALREGTISADAA